jgi:hypothetical protein
MCMRMSQVRPWHRWNWAGDEIVHNPIIPASRTVPGTRRIHYPIDIREYLSTESNAVVRDTLHKLVDRLSPQDRARFESRQAGAYDFRKDAIAKFMGTLAYHPVGRQFDQWLFPDETLAQGGGDCEDLAFLFAALLEATGVSEFCLRVALGAVIDHSEPGNPRRWDHAWVVYQNESGGWEILEPLAFSAPRRARRAGGRREWLAAAKASRDIEYVPYYVFNRHHLWRIRTSGHGVDADFPRYLKSRRFWERFSPTFAASVHEGILDHALAGMPPDELAQMKRVSFIVDVNVLNYDPREHFDFAYVAEGWDLVNQRLQSGIPRRFALAAHGIADFYAHTLYGEFAPRRPDGSLQLYDPAHPLSSSSMIYDFTPYAPLPGSRKTPTEASAYWSGRLISGQWWRWYSTFPKDLQRAPDFPCRRCLPDHDALAVDGPQPGSGHLRYDLPRYREQYTLRYAAAVEHVRNAYLAWRSRRGP